MKPTSRPKEGAAARDSAVVPPYPAEDLRPATALWARYEPAAAPHAFRATNGREATAWQEIARASLETTIGFQDTPPADPEPRSLGVVDKGDYTREKVVIRTAELTRMPVYLLRPARVPPPWPVVLAFHGHGYGAKDVVGLWEDGSERDTPDGYHSDFAVALCRLGFAVAAPEISCFGERQNDAASLGLSTEQPLPPTCDQTAALATHLGGSVVGLRVRDARRLVDWLETLSDFDTARLGCMGISGGGMHSLFSACIDVRIRAAVVSGYFSTFRGSILSLHHCPCNFVHGLGAFGEMADLAGLIAPRPLFVESGDHDPIFPVAAVREGLAAAARVYAVFGAADRLEHSIFEGRHRIEGVAAYRFLRERLGVGVSGGRFAPLITSDPLDLLAAEREEPW